MPRKPTQTEKRLAAIMETKGKKSLSEIWDMDRELEPTTVKQLQNESGITDDGVVWDLVLK